MKQADIIKYMESGKIFTMGIYWSGRVDTITARDPKSGGQRQFHIVRQTVMTDTDSLIVTRFMADSEKPEEWKAPFKKMQKVVINITGMQIDKGTTTLNGNIEALE